MTAPKYVRISALAAALLAIGGTSLWFARRSASDTTATADRSETEETEPAGVATASTPTPPSEGHAAADEADHHEDEHKPGDPSHPITPELLKVYRENNFLHTIDNAIMVKDYAAVRRMNAEYKKEFPNDSQASQEAYEMIADCLEEKTPERVARAREFWERRRSSRARRDLRRSCLE